MSEQDLIIALNTLSKRGNINAKQTLSRLGKKVLDGNKPMDIEFNGSSKDLLRSPKIINEFDSNEVKMAKEAHNERLKRNRTNWSNVV